MLSAGPSGFYNAPVTKGVLLVVGGCSLLASILQIKHNFHLQLIPHLTTHHQFWRLIASHFVFTNSSEVLFAGLILYNLRVIERLYGPTKYIAFLFVSALISTLLGLACLISGFAMGWNVLPAGPYGIVFAALYQYYCLIPITYEFKVYGMAMTDKVYLYLLAFPLLTAQLPGSAISAFCGLLTGAIYRSDIGGVRQWRFPPWASQLASKTLLPIFSSSPAIRSTVTTFEVRPTASRAGAQPAQAMREYLEALSSGGAPQDGTPRPPSEEQISMLLSIFPTATQDQAIEALNSSNNNMDGAVQFLLVGASNSNSTAAANPSVVDPSSPLPPPPPPRHGPPIAPSATNP